MRTTALAATVLTFFSVNADAFCLLAISARRGCLQVPGLSCTGAGLAGVDFVVLVPGLVVAETRALDTILVVKGTGVDIVSEIRGRKVADIVSDYRARRKSGVSTFYIRWWASASVSSY